jgi:organic hydroperoxide reductase OsmC/OhrA
MYKFPMYFLVHAQSTADMNATWTTGAEAFPQDLVCAIPPEFDGPGGGFSPEDVYALALTNCFIATFKVFAKHSRLDFESLHVTGNLKVDRNEKGQPWMEQIELNVTIKGATNVSLAERVFDKTKNGCLILNSVNTSKVLHLHLQ